MKSFNSSFLVVLGLALLVVHSTRAEYVWTGTEWEWKDPVQTIKQVDDPAPNSFGNGDDALEGSADSPFSDDEDDDYTEEEDNYDYKEEDDYNDYNDYKQSRKNSKSSSKSKIPKIGKASSFDDEDLSEGSGSEDGRGRQRIVEGDDDDDEGSGSFSPTGWRDTVTQPPWGQPDNSRNQPYVPEEEEDEAYFDHGLNIPTKEDDVGFGGRDDDRKYEVEIKTPPTSTTRTTSTDRPFNKPTKMPEVFKNPTDQRPASFFAQPGILAAVIGGAVVGLLCAILLVMFIVYRMRKKDEGSYALDEPKRSHNGNSYSKPPNREFYA